MPLETWLLGDDWFGTDAHSHAFDSGLRNHGRLLLSSRVAGVGTGVFLIFFFLALSLVLCALGSRTKYRWAVYAGSTAMFGIVALILIASPKGAKPIKPPEGYDRTIVPMVIILVLTVLGVLLGAVGMLLHHVLPTVYARPLSYHLDVLEMRH